MQDWHYSEGIIVRTSGSYAICSVQSVPVLAWQILTTPTICRVTKSIYSGMEAAVQAIVWLPITVVS